MIIAFDHDGTITKNPFIFKVLIDSLVKSEHRIYIISGTAKEDRYNLISELESFNISLIPGKIDLILKDTYSDIKETSEWKKEMIDRLKIRCYFENRMETAETIRDLCNVFLVM